VAAATVLGAGRRARERLTLGASAGSAAGASGTAACGAAGRAPHPVRRLAACGGDQAAGGNTGLLCLRQGAAGRGGAPWARRRRAWAAGPPLPCQRSTAPRARWLMRRATRRARSRRSLRPSCCCPCGRCSAWGGGGEGGVGGGVVWCVWCVGGVGGGGGRGRTRPVRGLRALSFCTPFEKLPVRLISSTGVGSPVDDMAGRAT
jgi:hypothetical protein